MHFFLDAGNVNILAFFELPNQPDMGRDENTPQWVQHLAFKVGSYDELTQAKAHLTANGVDVLGPTHHGIFKSIYFFDPNGHRVELACDIGTDEQYAELKRVAPLMRSEEHTSELQSLMRISYAVFCLKKKTYRTNTSQ